MYLVLILFTTTVCARWKWESITRRPAADMTSEKLLTWSHNIRLNRARCAVLCQLQMPRKPPPRPSWILFHRLSGVWINSLRSPSQRSHCATASCCLWEILSCIRNPQEVRGDLQASDRWCRRSAEDAHFGFFPPSSYVCLLPACVHFFYFYFLFLFDSQMNHMS